MDLSLNKKLALNLAILFILINTIGFPIVYLIQTLVYHVNTTDISLIKLTMLNLSYIVGNLSGIIIGLWLYINSEKYNVDKWTWLLIGLVFGYYSLLLIVVLLIFQHRDSKIELIESIQDMLGLLILTTILNLITKALSHFQTTVILETINFWLIPGLAKDIKWMSYTQLVFAGLVNILFTFKIYKLTKQNNVAKKYLWIVATLFTGLLPVIVLQILLSLKPETINLIPVEEEVVYDLNLME